MVLNCGIILPFDLREGESGKKFFEFLKLECEEFYPSKCGNYEPFKTNFKDLELALNLHWQSDFFWHAKNRKVGGSCMPDNYSWISLWDNRAKTVDEIPFENLMSKLSTEWRIFFASIHFLDLPEVRAYDAEASNAMNGGITPRILCKYIPNLPWGTWFGKEYIDLIGKKNLLECPVYRAELWSENLIYLQLTKNIFDCVSSFDEFERVRAKAKTHLGEQLFYSPTRPKQDYLVP